MQSRPLPGSAKSVRCHKGCPLSDRSRKQLCSRRNRNRTTLILQALP
jgi:hypothetical protein